MILWLDAHLPPSIAPWTAEVFGVSCLALGDLGLRDAADRQIFQEARAKGAVVVTKDADFILLQAQSGPPPQILWLTCGNTSKAKLKEIFAASLAKALVLLQQGEPLVEIR
jgi:predicted nuclease of predicted toxin-antitoxin system